MTDLRSGLGEAARAAFAELGLDVAWARVTASDRPDLADFQCNGALIAAKARKENPRDIAAKVAERLRAHPAVASVEVAGPGFINLRMNAGALAARANALADHVRAGASAVAAGRRVLIDYAGPNVAKEMHVGHLRASIIA